jgi:beta-glucanase (GH16 family)
MTDKKRRTTAEAGESARRIDNSGMRSFFGPFISSPCLPPPERRMNPNLLYFLSFFLSFLGTALILALLACGESCRTGTSTSANPPQWHLVWSDEFGGTNGSLPDPANLTYDIGGGGWGNQELECYTNRSVNVHVQDGNLVISALKENYPGPDGITCPYTSARIKTQGLFSQADGRFEARIKIPQSQGTWPAFWMLGTNFGQVPWPSSGEIDIMENIGSEPSTFHGTVHRPGYFGDQGNKGRHGPGDRRRPSN